MCGVAAIYSYKDNSKPVNIDELLDIRDMMKNRGPDAKGSWVDESHRVGLAHRRLSIIDLSNYANQPMINNDGDCIVSFNGEIYNYKQLRKDLKNKGYVFRTKSDTEVLLNLYKDKGTKMCSFLRGMFAFVIWDKKNNTLIFARDSYGIKPLYYSDDGKTIRIASQVKALSVSAHVSHEQKISPGGIVGFLLFGSIPEPLTSFSNIRSLPSGSVATVTKKGVKIEKYFSLSETYQELFQSPLPKNINGTTKDALLDAVSAHTIADVPVGIFLSSGIDSCSLLSLMHRSGYENIHSMTLSFEEFSGTRFDEAPLAEKIAKNYNLNHKTCRISKNDFDKYLPFILNDMDQPSIDGINTWFVSKAAKKNGLKVALSGLGGDELFGGYPSFKNIPKMLSLKRNFGGFSGFPKFYQYSIGMMDKIRKLNDKMFYVPSYFDSVYQAYLLQRCIFFPHEISQILGNEFSEQGFNELYDEGYNFNILKCCPEQNFPQISVLETEMYMKNQLLRDSDWAGMAHSVEIRVPLVDTRLLQTIGPIVLKMKKNKNKCLLGRNALSEKELKCLNRKKTGFGLPLQKWFNSTNNIFTERYPEAMDKNCHWSKKYALHVLDTFHHKHLI